MNEWKQIARRAKRAGDADLPALYLEVFGAGFSGAVTPSRARESIIEACMEMINMAKKTESNEITLETINAKLDKILAWMDHVKPTGFNGTVVAEGRAIKLDKTEKKEEIKVVDVHTAEAKLAAGLKEREKEEKITMEQLRAIATRYSNAFGMNDLIACVSKFGGVKKLSAVPEDQYAALASEMEARLAREGGAKAEEAKPAEAAKTVTLDEVKPKAKAFMDKHGQPALAALLKSFGAAKLSEVATDKLPALLEAFSNA